MNTNLIQLLRESNTVPMVEILALLANGADVNQPDDRGITPLILAANKFDDAELVQVLIDNGADVSVRDEWGRTALMTAIMGNRVDNVRCLIKNGANVNACTLRADRTPAGQMPLIIACGMADIDIEIVRVLLDAGAMINATDEVGANAIKVAISVKRTDVMELLVEYGARINEDVRNLLRFYSDVAKTDIGNKIMGTNLS